MKTLRILAISMALGLSLHAQQKVSQRTAITGAQIDPAVDLLPVTDISAGTSGSKKATILEVFNSAPALVFPLSKLGQSGATSGQVPVWSGSAWVPGTGGTTYTAGTGITLPGNAITLSPVDGSIALSKLAQSGATNGQVAAWNGSAWAPATAASGGSFSALTGHPTDNSNLSTTLGTKANNSALFRENFERFTTGSVFTHLAQSTDIGGNGWRCSTASGTNYPAIVNDSVVGKGLVGVNDGLYYLATDVGAGVPIRSLVMEVSLKSTGTGGANAAIIIGMGPNPLVPVFNNIGLQTGMLHFPFGIGGAGVSVTTAPSATFRRIRADGEVGDDFTYYADGSALVADTRYKVSLKFPSDDVMTFSIAGKTWVFRDSGISEFAFNSFFLESTGPTGYANYFIIHRVTVNDDTDSVLSNVPDSSVIGRLSKTGAVTYPASQQITFPGTRTDLGTKLSSNSYPTNTRLYVAASSLNTVFGSINKFVGGAAVSEGGWISDVGNANTGDSRLGRAPAALANTIDAAVSSNAGGAEAVKGTWTFLRQLTVGDREHLTICGNLTGTNAKRIRFAVASPYTAGNVIFDSDLSGTPLNARTGPYELDIRRFCTTAFPGTYYAKMTLADGTVIGPQRLRSGINAESTSVQMFLTSTDAGAITIEGDDHEIKKRP
jgi:hypothetical protein